MSAADPAAAWTMRRRQQGRVSPTASITCSILLSGDRLRRGDGRTESRWRSMRSRPCSSVVACLLLQAEPDYADIAYARADLLGEIVRRNIAPQTRVEQRQAAPTGTLCRANSGRAEDRDLYICPRQYVLTTNAGKGCTDAATCLPGEQTRRRSLPAEAPMFA